MNLAVMDHSEIEEYAKSLSVSDIIDREMAAGIRFGPYHRKWLHERAPEKVRRYLELGALHPDICASRQGFTSMDVNDCPPASFSPVTASATETNLWTPAIWTPIPANDMRAGKMYEVHFGGVFTTTGTQGTLTLTPRCGQSSTPSSNVTLGASAAIAWAASQTTQPWYGMFVLGIRSLGLAASGATGTGNGFALFTNGTSAATAFAMGGAVPTTIDNTAATGLIVSATISVASQSLTAQWVALRSLN